ncbi:MAG: hypothetical protein DMG13_22385 [Acidobacteria bacterium]|nr:MAG: hypothetical protein DMG13_22385 [Acidobacteriota bacterium]
MQTLLEFLPEIARLSNREAVRWSNGLRTWVASYSELHDSIAAIVAYLDQRGAGKGDRVLIWAENRLEWVAVFWACVARGIQVVPVDYRFSAELVARIQAESKPKLVIDSAMLDMLAGLPPAGRLEPSAIAPDDVVEIVYTSGTTGEPKGVMHRHRNICANLRPFAKEIAKYKKWARLFQPIRILNLLPLSHMFGQSQGLFIPVLLEGSAAFTTETHPGRLIQIVHHDRISIVVSVPRILENLKNEVERQFSPSPPGPTGRGWRANGAPGEGHSVGVLRRCWRYRRIHSRFGWKFWAFVAGGARVDPELEDFWSRLGFLVIQGYGLTEASPVVAVNHPFNTRRGSLGKVVEGQDVMIAPDGEILVRGESVTITNGGWLHTGDLGEMDAEGRLYYRGRKKDVIVTPEGLNVHPEDVEGILHQFPEIRESAVIGIRSNGGEQVHAVLILKDPSADVQALIQGANERLETHQRIRGWSVWPAGDFPRTPSTLKVKRHEVARQLGTQPQQTQRAEVDLGAMSSLERVELLSQLEDQYQIELDEAAFSKLQSARELKEWLRQPQIAAAAARREAPLSEWARSAPVRWLRTLVQHTVAIPLFRSLLTLTVTGLENLDDLQTPVIFAANHTSHLDVPSIYTALPFDWRQRLAPATMQDHFRAYFEPQRFSRKEVLGASLAYFLACAIFNAYPLPQQMSGARRALKYTGDLISRGYCLPVVPIRLCGLYEIYSVHDSWPRRGPVHVVIGRPLAFPATMSYEEAALRLEETMRQM